ncbi:MAG: Fic family protein [Candidatus Wallbacteria bacterium]|nr:Fic family protein [Candidatus Wallbacteria bacterium]
MKSFTKTYLNSIKLTHGMLSTIRVLGECKGREELFTNREPDVLESLLENALIQSAESSNRIEGITAGNGRVEKIVKNEKTELASRSEAEIAGYRDALKLIHENHRNIPVRTSVILQFHAMLYRYTTVKAGAWKVGENEIIELSKNGRKKVRFKPVTAADTSRCMEGLILSFKTFSDAGEIEPLILVALFILDFLCIHPFADGNGRVARLLTLLLLYKAGFMVGKYISLEKIVEDSKESYYDCLYAASQKWHDSMHDSEPWIGYFLSLMTAAYKAFEEKAGEIAGSRTKTEQIMKVIDKFVTPFAITDVGKACPNVSIDMIRKVVRELRDQGRIEATGKGRGAKWRKK